MTILIAGATGATGKLLVEMLLSRGHEVKAIVRSPEKLSQALKNNERLHLINANMLEISDEALVKHVQGCQAVASCLGHVLSLKGIYGDPKTLVTQATINLCKAIKANDDSLKAKFLLMNTAGNKNRDLQENDSIGERIVISILRKLLPPQADNEMAAEYLRVQIGQHDDNIEWSVIRPDNLIDANNVSEYHVHPSPTRSAIFKAGQTSRINVAHFMADLITDESIWNKWKGRMPVIYNASRR